MSDPDYTKGIAAVDALIAEAERNGKKLVIDMTPYTSVLGDPDPYPTGRAPMMKRTLMDRLRDLFKNFGETYEPDPDADPLAVPEGVIQLRKKERADG